MVYLSIEMRQNSYFYLKIGVKFCLLIFMIGIGGNEEGIDLSKKMIGEAKK